MSRIPRRKSRKITVDGRSYRWLLKGGRSRYRGNSAACLTLIVQEDLEKPGDPIVADFVSMRITADMDEEYGPPHKAAFSPGDVAKAIRLALQAGWRPDVSTGKVFTFKTEFALSDYKFELPKDKPRPRDYFDKLLKEDFF
jgi:hypothetical protein